MGILLRRSKVARRWGTSCNLRKSNPNGGARKCLAAKRMIHCGPREPVGARARLSGGVQATHGSSHRSRKPAAARLAGFNSLAFRSPPFGHNGHEALSLRGLPAFLAEQLVDRLARGDRTCPHFGIERHTQRMIEGRAEDLRWDWIVI